jgi:AraC-like DNA-binding protein
MSNYSLTFSPQSNTAQPTNIAAMPVWHSLTRTFAITLCPKNYRLHTARILQFLDTIICPLQPEFVLFKEAISSLYKTQGQMRIEELASSSGLSRRHLERQFKQTIGLSPKRLARLIRFEAVRDQLLRDPLYSLNDLPFEFGYTDQAHFIHDFKGLAAFTPGEFVSLILQGNTMEDSDTCVISRECSVDYSSQ